MKTVPACVAVVLSFGVALAAEAPVIPLWPGGAPGSEARKDEAEKVVNARKTNVHHPTVTVFLPPKDRATGAAVVIAPGGGHGHVTIDHEGYAVARWLAERGIAGFALTYRLARDTAAGGKSSYTVEDHALADIQRALRLVRARAGEWNLDPAKVGVMGFSAGGELAFLAASRGDAGRPDAPDPIDRRSSRADFAALIYAAGLARADAPPPKDLPPLFLLAGGDDRIAAGLPAFYLECKKAGVSAELHIYAGIGHGFGIQDKNPVGLRDWPERFRGWLIARKVIAEPAP